MSCAGNAQRPLSDAWRRKHGTTHTRRIGPVEASKLETRVVFHTSEGGDPRRCYTVDVRDTLQIWTNLGLQETRRHARCPWGCSCLTKPSLQMAIKTVQESSLQLRVLRFDFFQGRGLSSGGVAISSSFSMRCRNTYAASKVSINSDSIMTISAKAATFRMGPVISRSS